MVPSRQRRAALAPVLALAAALAAACERRAVDNVYMPLESGRRWTYTLVAEGAGGAAPASIEITSHGEEDLGGQRVTRERIDVGGESHWLFVGVDDRGVFRYATQSAGESDPVIDAGRDYYLVYPVTVGTSWKGESEPSFLEARVRVPIESTVVSTSETVAVPAGEFRDCVLVRTTGKAALPAAGGGPEGTFSVREDVWYASDVGMVRSVVVETIDGADGQRAAVTTELAEAGR